MSNYYERLSVGAAPDFSTVSNPVARLTIAETRRQKKRCTGQISLENLSVEYSSPFLLASSGQLEELVKYMERYGGILKEQDEHQATVLHHAASANQVGVMQYLIDSGIKLNTADKDGNTALHVATLQEHVEAISLLLSSRIDDKILNKNEDAGLHIAVRSNNTSLITAYFEHHHIEITIEGHRKRTPLHIIAELDNIEVCEVFHNSVLLREMFKNKPEFRLCAGDEDDITPIHLAARKGSHLVLDFFMKKCKLHKYPLDAVLAFLDEENSTPLHAAVDGGHIKVVEVLLKHGANPVVNSDSQVPPFFLACSQGRVEMIEIMMNHCSSTDIIRCRDMYGQACLHRSTHSINCSRVVFSLVDRGAEVNAVDNRGQTPLMISIITGSVIGVAALLERGADVLIKDMEGNNAMHHTVTRKRKKILELLLKLPVAAVLVTGVNNKGQSPIHLALKMGLAGIVNPLINKIKNKLMNIKDEHGNNYLHLAAQGGDWKVLSILLEIPECLKLLNEVNKVGGTPLHVGAHHGYLHCVELLLSHGAMIHKCYLGSTPFMNACFNGHTDVARALFDAHPFQINWTSDKGDNSLHMAARSSNPHMITLLLDIGISIVHNLKQESFLDVIILKNDVRCAAAVIQHRRYCEALDLVSPEHEHPMISLIVNMPEIAKQVLDRCHTKSELAHQNPDYWEKYDFKYLRLRDIEEEESQLQSNDDGMVEVTTVKYNGRTKRYSLQRNIRKTKSLYHLRALMTMVKFNRYILLTHPVSAAFFKNKWRSYGRWIHIFLVFLVFLQVLFLLLFTTLIPLRASVLTTTESTNISALCGNETNGTVKCLEFSYSANICRFTSLALATLNFVIWLLVVVKLRLDALDLVKNTYILIDLLSVVFTIYYLIPTRGLDSAYWSAGAIATFFSWFSLFLKIQLFDVFGVYITMFLTITRTVFHVLIICFLFIMAFSISLYILAGNLTQYSRIGYSIFVNLGHLFGELDYESFVTEDVDGNLGFNWLTFMFVTTLAILMGVVIMNLLIGLAVGDIEQIRNRAIAGKKLVELSFFSQIDSIVPSKLLAKLDKPSYTKYPNDKSVLSGIWKVVWNCLKPQNRSLAESRVGSDLEVDVDNDNKDLLNIKRQVEELTAKQEKIFETLSHMHKVQEDMLKIMLGRKDGEDAERC